MAPVALTPLEVIGYSARQTEAGRLSNKRQKRRRKYVEETGVCPDAGDAGPWESGGGRVRSPANRRRAGCIDDQDVSIHRQRHDVFAGPKYQPCCGLAEVFREEFHACLRFHEWDAAR